MTKISLNKLIAVASIDKEYQQSSFSNTGYHVDFAYYGEKIYGIMPEKKFEYKSGTSQSTAIITGIVSRILAYDNTIQPDQLKVLLQKSAKDINIPGVDQYSGYGIPDIDKISELLQITPKSNFQRLTNEFNRPVYDTIVFEVEAFNVTNILNYPNPVPKTGTKFILSPCFS